MLRHVLFDLELFANEADREDSQKKVLILLEALTLLDQLYLAQNPETPLLYDLVRQGKLIYKLPAQFEKETSPDIEIIAQYLIATGAPASVQSALRTLSNQIGGGETFRDIPRIIENGGGDCDNLCAWRTAEIRHHLGVAAKPYITWRKRPDGGTTYHCITIWPDGSSEDSSLLSGMSPERVDDVQEEIRKLAERREEAAAEMQAPMAERIAGEVARRVRLRRATNMLLGGRGK